MVKYLAALPAAAVAFSVGAISLPGWAGDKIPYDEAEIFFELNDTDEDLGIHALIDGDPWKKLSITGPGRGKGGKMLDIHVKGQLRQQGLTEIFFESAEPDFDELDPEDFFNRFPEGEYSVSGETLEREKLESVTELTHLMPAPPVPTVNTQAMEENCDEGPLGSVGKPVTISWLPVTLSHPDAEGTGAGADPPETVTIHNYEVVVEVEIDDDFESVMHVTLPPGETSLTLPDEFIDQAETDDIIKYEVLAREESFNQTAVESCFRYIIL